MTQSSDYDTYLQIQLKTAVNPLSREIAAKLAQLVSAGKLNDGPRMYSAGQIRDVLAECDRLIDKVAAAQEYWTPGVRSELEEFLSRLPADGYLTPHEVYETGKRRDYRAHVVSLTRFIGAPDAIVLDVAGRTGWASTVLHHLGFPNALTIELNPINIIGGRYIWGHRDIIQGDVHALRKCEYHSLDFSRGRVADVIFCRYSLEHFQDLRAVFKEFAYVLKPGGKVVLIVGRATHRQIETGDLHAFPNAKSIYQFADEFVLVDYSLRQNSDTGAFEHHLCLQKASVIDSADSQGVFRSYSLGFQRLKREWILRLKRFIT